MTSLLILVPIFNENFYFKNQIDNININSDDVEIIFFVNNYKNNIKTHLNIIYDKEIIVKLKNFIMKNNNSTIIISTFWNIPNEKDINIFKNSINKANYNLLFYNSTINCQDGLKDFELNIFRFYITESYKYIKNSKDNHSKIYEIIRNEFTKMNLPNNILRSLPLTESSFYIRVLNNLTYSDLIKYEEMVNIKWNYIDKRVIDDKINKLDKIGTNIDKRDVKIIISLTSFPDRINEIQYCIYSLLNQKLKPDELVLWLAEEQFPNKEKDLPVSLLKFQDYGLSIKWCNDIKSYKKLIPALKEYPNDFIVTVDDDIYYSEYWLENMWNTYKKFPKTIISSRARSIKINNGQIAKYVEWDLVGEFKPPSFLSLPTGAGGVLYYPNALSEEVFNENLFNKLSPTGDDLWFWAMAVKNESKITCVEKPFLSLNYINVAQESGIINNFTLWNYNQDGHNDIQLNNILTNFPEILEIINNE